MAQDEVAAEERPRLDCTNCRNAPICGIWLAFQQNMLSFLKANTENFPGFKASVDLNMEACPFFVDGKEG
jgi:hypothetical protein